jgi:response regulator RpfG family c-di-GMP phosphodiesterase
MLFHGKLSSMDKQQLREQLGNLHAELQQVESVDEDERAMLQKLATDVGEILERGDDHPHQHYGRLGERLREAVAQVEASHPRATMLMRQVIDELAYMGI